MSGAPPRLCLWEAHRVIRPRPVRVGIDTAGDRQVDGMTTEVDPPTSAQRLKLFLYGDWPPTGAAQDGR